MINRKNIKPLTSTELRLILKVVYESKHLHGSDFEPLVSTLQKIQALIKQQEEDK